jgi:hypothetical protein
VSDLGSETDDLKLGHFAMEINAPNVRETLGEQPITVIFVGERPVGSSPLLTLAEAVKQHGVHPVFSEHAESASTIDWLRLVRRSDVVLFVAYTGPGAFMIRQLALAACLGKPIVRWWVGSDVLYCLQDQASARWARVANTLCSAAVTGAPHLQGELAAIGLRAILIPTVVNPEFLEIEPPRGAVARDILVYLPTNRGPFYGEEVVAAAIRANPDLQFIVVGDTRHRFRGYRNVESLGWVENMRPIYDRTGCLLRMTQHDSLPRMAIETLLLGKYVICSHEFPGCWVAKDSRDVQKWISVFRTCNSINEAGMAAIKNLLTPPPGVQFANLLRKSAEKPRVAARVGAMLALVPLTLLAHLLDRET